MLARMGEGVFHSVLAGDWKKDRGRGGAPEHSSPLKGQYELKSFWLCQTLVHSIISTIQCPSCLANGSSLGSNGRFSVASKGKGL